jgi:phage protein D
MSEARTPSVNVLVNGVLVPGILDVEVIGNNHLAANRFRFRASLTASGYHTWASDVLSVEIRIGLAGAWSSLIYGEVDQLDVDVGRGVVHVDGRDLTSRFIESRTQESFENQTASEVALTLAARRGLTPVITPTMSIIGRDFENGTSRVTLSQHARFTTEWDLLIGLAGSEGFDVWVEGQALYFSPPDQTASELTLCPSDCLSIRLQRLATLSGGIAVTVRSWDSQGQRAVEQIASSAQGGRRSYSITQPNLTEGAAQIQAQRLMRQMAQHERSVCIEMPGDLTTRPRDLLTLVETNTDFDGMWSITSVERRLSFHHGFTQVLEARIPAWTIS